MGFYMALVTFNQLKESAKADGYNVDNQPFINPDWPIIKAWLFYKKQIVTNFNDMARDIYNHSPSCADIHVTDTRRFGSAVTGGVEYLRVYLHTGIYFGLTDTISIEGAQLLLDGKLVNSAEVTYEQQDLILFVRATAGAPFLIKSEYFSYSSDGSDSGETEFPAIVDQAVCDYSIVDKI